jgi:ABC-type oligopeptide transport system substrate-binding subunit/ABC-type branched-subunit amino acid transport system substrate-binding protein
MKKPFTRLQKMMIKPMRLFVPALLLITISSCDFYFTPQAEERSRKAALNKGDVVIGVVETSADPSLFTEGVNLAIEEINSEGGLLGRKLRAEFRDDERTIAQGQHVAKDLAKNPDVIAVVGHRYPGIAIPVSIIYEKYGILFISPGASNPDYIQYGGNLTFTNIPSDYETARNAAELARSRGFRKMVLFYQRDTAGKRLAEIFHEEAVGKEIKILTTRSFFRWQKDFKVMLSELVKEYEFDAILLAGVVFPGADLIKQARSMGINVPVIGGYQMDSPDLFSTAGEAAEGVIVPTVFNPDLPVKETQDFIKNFQSKYGVIPDMWAAQGYDAVRVLAYSVRESESTVPIVIASAMRILQDWNGVTGRYSFNFDGGITGKSLFFKEVRNGRFEYAITEKQLEEKPDPFYVVEDITLRLPVEGIIPTIDPGLTRDITSSEVTEQLFVGLTDLDPETYEPVPELATDWTVSNEGRTYTFDLRQDVKWTNGEPVTAHDVVWAVRRNILPETKSPYASSLYILKNAGAINKGEITDPSALGVRAAEDFKVEFELEDPVAYFPAVAGLGVYRPLPAKTVETYGEKWTEPENIVSNGSYRVAEWEKGMVMILRKNPDYYEAEKVSIPEVRYYVLPESSVGLAMYESNELDIMGSSYLRIPLADIRRIKDDPLLSREYFHEPQFCTYAFAFNTSRPPVDNPLVRKAIVACIDRSRLTGLVTQGGEIPAATYVRPPVFGAVDPKTGIGISFNPIQAKKWLAAAGYPEGKDFPKIQIMFNSSETHAEIAHAIQVSLKYFLNIDAELDERKWEDYIDAMGDPGNLPHIFRFGWCSDYPDADNWLYDLFHPVLSPNYVSWKNAEFAQLMDDARKSLNSNQRKALYQRAEQILCEEDCAVIPLYFETAHCLVKSRIKGWYHMAVGGQHIRNWYFEN